MAKQAPGARGEGAGLRVLVLHAAFNRAVVEGLRAGARSALREAGVAEDAIEEEEVPGAFELPLAAQVAADTGRFDAIVALGAVIRGETDHYDHVAREAASGLMQVARESRLPVAFGVLTVREEAHALSRSAPGAGNKGAEAARAAVATAQALRAI